MRSSNLELYRIICMLFIVAHHYVVNSGLLTVLAEDHESSQRFIYYCFGAWGKTGINCFVLITGYFMCKSDITVKKLVKLLLEIYFYSIVITLIFILTGYARPSIHVVAYALVPIQFFTHNFVCGFIFLFLCIPFLNILVSNIDQVYHLRLVGLLLISFSIIGSIPKVGFDSDYASWFPALYLIASYIRFYDFPIKMSHMQWGMIAILSIALACISIIAIVHFYRSEKWDFLLNESNKLFAISTAISTFMWFKGLKMRNSNFVNTIASSTFGVLLIHANSDTMRQWLWKDTLHVADNYPSDNMIWHYLLSVIIIYIVCTCIDQLRIRFVERPIFNYTKQRNWF